MSNPALSPAVEGGARLLANLDTVLLSRVEDAGLNASAPPQQRWLDGWLVRLSPGKAQRARCINAVAAGRRAVADKLAECAALFAEAGLPLLVRVTPFTQPADLDHQLAANGWALHDETRVMVLPTLSPRPATPAPRGATLLAADASSYAPIVGTLRGTSLAGQAAHAERLSTSPVPYLGYVLHDERGAVLGCAQIAREGPLVGLYDVHTADGARGKGFASWICEHLLSESAKEGAASAYLQVGADNHAARRIYARMGFVDAYGYHYRVAPAALA